MNEKFLTDGYAILRDVVPPDQLESLRDTVDELVARHRAVDADPLPATRRTRTKHSPALSPIAPSPCGRGAMPPDATALPACVLPPSVSPRTPPV